jgi:putative heme-binding domain-containing protein
MTFTPDGDLLFIDNAGGGNPTEELNLMVPGGYYGHNKRKFAPDTVTVTRPIFDLGFDIAPSGIEFTRSRDGFAGHDGNLFVSYYGPGERWTRGAISRLDIRKGADGTWSIEEHAVADLPKLSDIAFGPDGALYAAHHGKADYWYNAVFDHQGHFYKIMYDPNVKPAQTSRPMPDKTFAADAVEAGKQLFAELSCLGCHQVDGTTELLGPNLKDIGRHLSRAEILEEILEPSKRIKASMIGMEIEKTDGTKLLGRVVSADSTGLTLMLVGNQVVHVARKDIWKQSEYPKSLMYERLVNGLAPEKVDQLLDYIMSLSR